MINAWDIENHLIEFPHAAIYEKEDRVYGIWCEGNNYKRVNNYHGEYPPSYLRRVMSLFPYRSSILHLFSGSIKREGEITFDINPGLEPDMVGSAEHLSQYFDEDTFDFVLADPPYTLKDADLYGYKMPRKHLVMQEIRKVITDDGILVWLDLRKPIYRKEDWRLAGNIGYDCGTNRMFRGIFIFEPK